MSHIFGSQQPSSAFTIIDARLHDLCSDNIWVWLKNGALMDLYTWMLVIACFKSSILRGLIRIIIYVLLCFSDVLFQKF